MLLKLSKEQEDRASILHEESIFINMLEYYPELVDPTYLDRALAAGETACSVTVFASGAPALKCLSGYKHWRQVFEEHGDKAIKVLTAKDIERAHREKKLGIIMSSQHPEIIADDPNLLTVYSELGLKIMQLAYYMQTSLGEGYNERTNGGLTKLGLMVVEEMNRLGMLVDVSHCGDQVVLDAIEFSKAPVAITHANPRALVNHKRNKTDEQIKALASRGGVIGVNGYSPIMDRGGVRPGFDDLLDFIDYIVNLVGPDYVGLGLDVTPFWTEPRYEEWAQAFPELRGRFGWRERSIFTNEEGHDDVYRIVEITRGLVVRGYSDEDIKKILGLNFLRLFNDVWGD